MKLYIVLTIFLITYASATVKDCDNDTRICILKCCPDEHYVTRKDGENVCEPTPSEVDYKKVPVFYSNLTETGNNLLDLFTLVAVEIPEKELEDIPDYLVARMIESGYLSLNGASIDGDVQLKTSEFCVTSDKDKPYGVGFKLVQVEDDNTYKQKLRIACNTISCICLFLVLIIHAMFKSLRTEVGKMLMLMATSLLCAFAAYSGLLIVLEFKYEFDIEYCYSSTFIIEYFFLASFGWMNVISFDIWNQIRTPCLTIRKNSASCCSRRIVTYSVYAWGIPLTLSTTVICIDLVPDPENYPEWLIKPNIGITGCFLGDDHTRFLYLIIPMLVLISINCTFFGLTAYKIWQIKQDTSSMGMSTPNNLKQRFKIYLKLSVMMGITWILEGISYKLDNVDYIWIVADVYNALIGVGIFIITIVKKNVLRLLAKRFGIDKGFKQSSTNSDKRTKSTFKTKPSFSSDKTEATTYHNVCPLYR